MATKRLLNQPIAPGIPVLETRVPISPDNIIRADIEAVVSDDLLGYIDSLGGVVVNDFPQYRAIRAFLPISQLEVLADRADVAFIRPARDPLLHKVDTSEGDVAHRADDARTAFSVDGTGVKVGVLSDSVDALADLQASGDLPAVTVLPGQSGNPGSSEGTALLEIVFDLAPGAQLFYATAFGSQASFAANIIALQEAGCDVIVDDVGYFAEYVFQDDNVAQAVETVTSRGAAYFSSAGNSGNKNDGTSGVWEGDWLQSGADPFGDGTLVHDFGGNHFNTLTLGSSSVYTLHWSDPGGASTNDYDLFLINSAGTTVTAASQNTQSGTQDPFEIIGAAGSSDTGRHLLVVKASGAAGRFLHVNTNRGRLTISTVGQIGGHPGAVNAFAVAAVDIADAGGAGGEFDGTESIETFSSDGPRRVFYQAGGTPITPGNFSSTGVALRPKPDVTGADGVSTATPGFDPFFGTSASAPHTAAIAALLIEQGVATTSAGIRTIMFSSALDIEASGIDNDSGAGIVDAITALTLADADVRVTPVSDLESAGPEGGSFAPTNKIYTITNNGLSAVNWTASASETWVDLSSTGGNLASSASTNVTVSFNTGVNALAAGSHIAFVTFSHDGDVIDQVRRVDLAVRGLSHFEWDTVSSPQSVDASFSVTVTARDSEGATLSTFTDTVSLSGAIGFGFAPTIVISEMGPATPDVIEFINVSGGSVDISNWVITLYDTITFPSPLQTFTIPASTTAAAAAIFTLEEFGTAPGTYPSFFTGANINWTVGSTGIAMLLQDDFGNIIDFATTGNSTLITSPVSIPSAQWSGAGISTTVGNRSHQRDGNADNNDNSDWFDANYTIGSVNSGLTIPFLSPIVLVNVSPATSGSFAAGVWSGNVTVLEAATGMHLNASDGSGHLGDSNTFDALGDFVSISVTPGTWSIGPRALNVVVESGTYTVENTGSVAEDITITATDGANSWTLSGTVGTDTFKVEADQADDGSYETVLTTADQTFVSNLGVSSSESLGLRYSSPSGDTQGGGTSQDFTVTITASEHVP